MTSNRQTLQSLRRFAALATMSAVLAACGGGDSTPAAGTPVAGTPTPTCSIGSRTYFRRFWDEPATAPVNQPAAAAGFRTRQTTTSLLPFAA